MSTNSPFHAPTGRIFAKICKNNPLQGCYYDLGKTSLRNNLFLMFLGSKERVHLEQMG